jgi:predicted dienelactone hydrolase
MKHLLALCLLLVGCPAGDDDDSASEPGGPDPLAWDVQEFGPFNVGYRTWTHTYTPPGDIGERTIEVHLWYPTEDESGEGIRYLDVFQDVDSWSAAIPAAPVHDGGYPVHAYTHGHQGFAGSSSFLPRRLASHGWVTIAPDHTDNTFLDNVSPRATSLFFTRSTDITESLDQLETVGASHLAGTTDTSRVLLSGHSFGSHSTWASGGATFDMDRVEQDCADGSVESGVCTDAEIDVFRAGLRDDRVVALMPMAGTPRSSWFGETGHLDVQHPVLNMSGSVDDVGASAFFDRSTGLDFTWIDIEGGCHQAFGLGACDELPSDEGFSVLGTWALAFGRRHVLNDEDETVLGILDHSISVSDRITYQRHLP